jgi:replicative DNA helicase
VTGVSVAKVLQDPAAERAVIACVFHKGGEAFADVAEIVRTSTFTVDSNQAIWSCLENICQNDLRASIDYPSVLSAARTLGLLEFFNRDEEKKHLRSIMNLPVKPENLHKMAGKIRKLEIARQLATQLELARASVLDLTGDEPIDEIIHCATGPVDELTLSLADRTSGIKKMGDGAAEYAQYLIENPRQSVGISFGLPQLENIIGGGLRPNGMDVFAARMKVGKTMLVDHMALYIAEQGIPVLNLDTEMSWEEHLCRVLANRSMVRTRDIERGMPGADPSQKEVVVEAGRRLASLPYYYRCICEESFEETLAATRRWITKTVGLDENGFAKPCVVILDYLKVGNERELTKTNLAEWQKYGFMATAIKNIGKKFKVPLAVFAQLNREGEIGASDRILMYCTSFTVFREKTAEDKAAEPAEMNRYSHMLEPRFARYGERMRDGDYINVKTMYAYAKLAEGPTRLGPEQMVEGDGDAIRFDGGTGKTHDAFADAVSEVAAASE